MSTEHMGVPLRKIDSEGDYIDAAASVTSTKRGRKGSNATPSYLAPTKNSVTKSMSKKKSTKKNGIGVNKLDDLDLTEINNDGTHYNPDGLNLDDT